MKKLAADLAATSSRPAKVFDDDEEDDESDEELAALKRRELALTKKTLRARTGLDVKKKYCTGDFCGYDSGEEKLIMNEVNANGNENNRGANAAIRLARKAAKDAKAGARRMKEDQVKRARKRRASSA